MWPLDKFAQLDEELAEKTGFYACHVATDEVLELAAIKDPFPCSQCGSEVEATTTEVSELFTDVIQSIRRGHCMRCNAEAEFENRFYRGNLATKIRGGWYVAVVRPSLLERIWHRITR